MLSAFLGSLALIPIFLFLRQVASPWSAFFSCLALALSPYYLRYTTYYIHEVPGFFFFHLILYLTSVSFEKRKALLYLSFGLAMGALASLRVPSALLLLPLLIFLVLWKKMYQRPREVMKLLSFSFLGFLGMVLLLFWPQPIRSAFLGRASTYFSITYSLFGHAGVATRLFLNEVSPPLLLAFLGAVAYLFFKKQYFIGLLSLTWVVPIYLFYTGVAFQGARYGGRFFLCSLPGLILPVFYAAEVLVREDVKSLVRLPELSRRAQRGLLLFAQGLLLLLLFFRPFIAQLPMFHVLSNFDPNAFIAEKVMEVAHDNLILVGSIEPLLHYYAFPQEPDTFYLTGGRDGGKTFYIKEEGIRLAQERLRDGQQVYITDDALACLHAFSSYRAEVIQAWQWRAFLVYRLVKVEKEDS